MSGLFRNILVPVDFSTNTEVAVKQAIEFACVDGSTIDLLHVIKPKTMWNCLLARTIGVLRRKYKYPSENVMLKMQQWAQFIEGAVLNCKVITDVRKGAVQMQIENAAKELGPELILIVKKTGHKLFDSMVSVCPNAIAKSTNCPVLTLTRRVFDKKVKIIVMPVGAFVPKRKIELVVEFAKKHRAEIHLVTMPNEFDVRYSNKNSFIETYRILRSGLTNPIRHHILKGNNFPRAILDYAECIQADMVFVHPFTETKISSFTGKHINNALTSSSKLKILSVEPYHDN